MLISAVVAAAAVAVAPNPEDDRRTVAALDIAYQAAVKRGDVATMERILHPEFVLVRSDGKVVTRQALIAEAPHITYEIQDEDEGTQAVRVFGDAAVVTARLRVKGVARGVAFDRRVWFSDTYVRTPQGWRYAFAQVAAIPEEAR